MSSKASSVKSSPHPQRTGNHEGAAARKEKLVTLLVEKVLKIHQKNGGGVR